MTGTSTHASSGKGGPPLVFAGSRELPGIPNPCLPLQRKTSKIWEQWGNLRKDEFFFQSLKRRAPIRYLGLAMITFGTSRLRTSGKILRNIPLPQGVESLRYIPAILQSSLKGVVGVPSVQVQSTLLLLRGMRPAIQTGTRKPREHTPCSFIRSIICAGKVKLSIMSLGSGKHGPKAFS